MRAGETDINVNDKDLKLMTSRQIEILLGRLQDELQEREEARANSRLTPLKRRRGL
jgi:hypothetical protein